MVVFELQQIRPIKTCVGSWLASWLRKRERRETTSETPELNTLIAALKTCGIAHSEDEVDFVVECVRTYLRIYLENCRGYPGVDMVGHSALLTRLLLGKPPLSRPPPLRFAYPCYELGEGSPVTIVRLKEVSIEGGRTYVEIDQYAEYEWVDKEKGLLRHLRDGDIYHVDLRTMQMQRVED